MTEWRDGAQGALVMGLKHGTYCVGCCWFLMELLFVAGVMNLLWVATITAFVLAEKVLPRGDMVGRVAGGFLCWLASFSSASLDNEGTSMAEKVSSHLQGILLGACNCDWGCPRNFETPPTKGFCEGDYI